MGKKYIVEIGRLERLYKASVNGNGKPNMTWLSPEVDLTPYTEPDLEQVNAEKDKIYDEARARGYEEGKARGYQEGLFDAWEAARKIANYALWDDYRTDSGKLSVCTGDVLDYYTASEAIGKIRQYEQRQEEQIQVGDEVINRDKKAVVTEITDRFVRIMYSNGSGYALFSENMTKTGRHFPEISTVLKKMRGEQDG